MVDNDCTLSFIGRLKRYYNECGEKALTDLSYMPLDEDTEFLLFYEALIDSEFLVSSELNEETCCCKYFFSSEEMTEYYRLAKKIGRLKGWRNKKNKYISDALFYTVDRLCQIHTDGSCYGNVYSGTKHKYASSVNIYVYEEGCFYDYAGLYFAINAIFYYYEKQLRRLKKIYAGIIAISLSLLIPQELEVAA